MFFRPFALRPFIFVCSEFVYGNPIILQAKMKHEAQHVTQQKNMLYLPVWLFLYFWSKSFRRRQENQAFTVEMSHLVANGITPNCDNYKNSLLNDYWKAYTPDQAEDVVAPFRAK